MSSARRPTLVALIAAALVAAAVIATGACSSKTASPKPDDLVVMVASYNLAVGAPDRFLVGLLTADQRGVAFGRVEERFSYLGTKDHPIASPTAGPAVSGTFLPVPGTDAPPDEISTPQVVTGSQARGVYSSTVGFDQAGFWQVEVAATLGGSIKKATGAFEVADTHSILAVGDVAPATENLTMASADAPKAAIDSRGGSGDIPDPELHSTTVAAALAAKRPVVLVVSTPVYCTSRFCGPITDMVQDLAHVYGDRASFVHIEVWRDFQATPPVVNKAAAEWIFPKGEGDINEPWVFVIGADGRIVARFDNVAAKDEIEPILQQLPVIGPAAP